MIVKNEERHLGRLLASVVQFADEIVVLDTGSTDKTRAIALEFGARCCDFAWCDDFAQARNASMRHCSGDFIMWLDADDIIEPSSCERLKALFCQPIAWDVLYLPYYYHYTPENPQRGKRKMPPRIWRNRIGIHWIHPIHESLQYPGKVVKERDITGIEVLHYPLRKAHGSSERNLGIMKQAATSREYRHSEYMYWHIAKEFSHLGNPRQGVYYYEKAVALCDQANRFGLSRLYIGLARQYRLLGDYYAALRAAGSAAAAYRHWREPYAEIAENCFYLGDGGAGDAHLALAAQIPRHALQVERAELYTAVGFDQFSHRLRTIKPAPSAHADDQQPAVTLVAGGDVMLGRQLAGYTGLYGVEWPLQRIADYLHKADVAMVNLESVCSTLGDFYDKDGISPFYYHNRPEMLDLLIKAGVDVVCIANNHTMDFGPAALEQQMEILDDCGIAHFGAGRDYLEAARPVFVRAAGLTLAFIGVETDTPSMQAGADEPGIHYAAEQELLQAVAAAMAEARCHADVILVSPHWGKNWRENPTESLRRLARKIIDLGADAILGHSAHILQGIELHAGKPIVYDMGTLLFDRVSENRMKYSALFELELSRRGVQRLKILPVKLSSGRAKLAGGTEAATIRRLIVEQSQALNAGSHFREHEGCLLLDCQPASQPRPLQALGHGRSHPSGALRKVSEFYRDLKSQPVYAACPEDCRWSESMLLDSGMEIVGARIASPVYPGFGFLCEVFFHADAPPPGRWEARIDAYDEQGKQAFFYNHPIAESAWPSQRWVKTDVIGDRVVVRVPRDLAAGRYTLYWTMLDRQSGAIMQPRRENAGAAASMIRIGEVEMMPSAPARVAGLALRNPPQPS